MQSMKRNSIVSGVQGLVYLSLNSIPAFVKMDHMLNFLNTC